MFAGFIGHRDAAGDGIAQIDLAIDQVRPGRTGRILKIGHEHLGVGIERVDDHLAINRPGDLYATVLQRGRHRRNTPLAFANGASIGAEIRQFASVEALLPRLTSGEQTQPDGIEAPLQLGQQIQRSRRENLIHAIGWRSFDADSARLLHHCRHGRSPLHCNIRSLTIVLCSTIAKTNVSMVMISFVNSY